VRTLAFLLCLVVSPLALAGSEPLRSSAQILDLSPEEVEAHRTLELEAVLLMIDPDGTYIVHDGQLAVFACFPTPDRPSFDRGDQVRIRGVAKAGLFAPVIEIQSMVRIGAGVIPAPIVTPLSGLMKPHFNPQWVQVEGVVRSAVQRTTHPEDSVLEIAADGLRVPVVLSGVSPDRAAGWIGARVQLRAFCFHETNRKRQLLGAKLLVTRSDPLVVLTPAEADPYALPVRAPGDLLQYSRTEPSEDRVHVQGVVTQAGGHGTFYVQSGQEGIEVRSAQPSIPPPGTRVDVVGFVGHGRNGPFLEDAAFRVHAVVGRPEPRRILPADAIDADSTLVEMVADLENVITESAAFTLVLKADNQRFLARLPRHAEEPAPWRPGSRLLVTGICRATPQPLQQNDFAWLSGPFDLLLRSSDDVVLLKASPWWTRPETARVAALALLVAAVVSIVLFLRYREKVKAAKLTRRAAEREFDAVLKERGRVAREIHDTLAQGLTSISAQLELARQHVEGAAPAALHHLDLARGFVRESLAEARRSVWALRPQLLEQLQLPPALERIARELTSGTNVDVRIKSSGEWDELPHYLENELLRVGQEALTNAVRHGASKTIQIELQDLTDQLRLRISDDGRGFDTDRTGRSSRKGCGISGMQERVQLLNGHFELQSRPGAGTHVLVEIPKA
jgi:signal transduction histidine kinase